jgi:hypothetical protein
MSTLSQFLGGGGSSKLPFGVKDTAFYIDALIVGGGGGPAGGGSGNGSGGGRVVQVFNLLAEKNITYGITIGAAGANSTSNGEDSAFGSIIAQGGGAVNRIGGCSGGNIETPLFPTVGSYSVNDILNATNIISSGNGGSSGSPGGGGGAGTPGRPAGTFSGPPGGDGLQSRIKGPGPYFYGAGRGGNPGPFGPASDGLGAGGANTGTGGQNGVVVIAYPNTLPLATTIGAPTLFSALNPLGANATRTGYHVYEFTGSGSIRFN